MCIMKKMILAIAMVFATMFSANAMKEPVTDEFKVVEVIQNYYPHLTEYFAEGVMEIASLTEETLADGETEYNIKYKFVNYHLNEGELNSLLKTDYTNLYYMKRFGLIKDVSAIKFVDKNTGKILTKVSYNRSERKMGHRNYLHMSLR